MPDITRYVITDNTAGGNGTTDATSGANRAFASLAEWEAATQQNLRDVAMSTATVLCSGVAADTAACSLIGWVTGSTTYITIKGNPNKVDGRHQGRWSTSHYRMEVNFPAGGALGAINHDFLHVRLEGFQIKIGGSSVTDVACFWVNPQGRLNRSDDMICRQDPGASGIGNFHGIANPTSAVNLRGHNSVFYGFRNGTGARAVFNIDVASTGFLYNFGAYDCDIGFDEGLGSFTHKNCWTQLCTDGFDLTGINVSDDYNISDIAADAPGTNSKQATIGFINAAAGDFHLVPGDPEAFDFGLNLSADASDPFSDDIDGETRTFWSNGPDDGTEARLAQLTKRGQSLTVGRMR
jgi:hypothetical protein